MRQNALATLESELAALTKAKEELERRKRFPGAGHGRAPGAAEIQCPASHV